MGHVQIIQYDRVLLVKKSQPSGALRQSVLYEKFRLNLGESLRAWPLHGLKRAVFDR